ncbi:MAG: hypothetical protein RLZZ157_1602, partial [Pseudomonadota bacterium]
AFVKLLRGRQQSARIGIVANRVKSSAEANRIQQAFGRACGTYLGFEPAKAGLIHEDAHVKAALRAQTLLSRHAPDAVALADIEALGRLIRSGKAFETRSIQASRA